jgi:hypothetical protein
MTAQIAIMNKNAVALATDSAVTTRNSQGVKVHNSANKLFTLSKYHPVGIMIYSSADFMGYPWETLIKVFRRWLGKRSFATVDEYAKSFFEFLVGQNAIFTAQRQTDWLRGQAFRILSILNERFSVVVRAHIDQHGAIDDETVQTLFQNTLGEFEAVLLAKEILSVYGDAVDRDHFTTISSEVFDSVIAEVFQALPIQPFLPRLKLLINHRFLSDTALDYSGLVFAGFGESEMLPVVASFWVDGVFGGLIRHGAYPTLSANLNEDSGSWIIPFAQSDTVMRFLRGVDPVYKRESLAHVQSLVSGVVQHVNDSNANRYATAEDRLQAEEALRNVTSEQSTILNERLDRLERERFVSPVIDVIDSLPKDDLAAIAESFVNLTSFQRKILREVETVGGPIDAAVISKGDGFVWIKRKHYFDKDLNPAFFANYYQGDSDDE